MHSGLKGSLNLINYYSGLWGDTKSEGVEINMKGLSGERMEVLLEKNVRDISHTVKSRVSFRSTRRLFQIAYEGDF